MILEESVRVLYGVTARSVDPPVFFQGTVEPAGAVYPRYRLFLIAAGSAVGLALWLFLTRTRAGLLVRAVAQNSEMVGRLGRDPRRARTGAVALACAPAAPRRASPPPNTTP